MFFSQDETDDEKTTPDNIDVGGCGGHVPKSTCVIVFITDTGRVVPLHLFTFRNCPAKILRMLHSTQSTYSLRTVYGTFYGKNP